AKIFPMNQKHKAANKKEFCAPIKDQSEIENLAFYEHQVYGHAFNGNIGAPVHEKLRNGAKVLEFGTGIWTIEVADEYPNSKFYAIDFTAKNSIENIKFINYDIHQKLPFPDNEFDYIFSRNKTSFFSKDIFQRCLFEVLRVLKPGGWLEVGLTFRNNEFVPGPALTRLDNAYALWHKRYGFNPDLILNLEDHLKMIGKTESISSQTLHFAVGNDHFGEFSYEIFLYHIRLLKEAFAPIMGISFEEYDHFVGEIENEMNERLGEIIYRHKKVLARKKDMGIIKDA
ncbi:12549_t:CDS:2, partial [Dentiscutata erythropus]